MVAVAKSPAMNVYSFLFTYILEPEMVRLTRILTGISDRQLASGAPSNVMIHKGQLIAPPIRIGSRPAAVHPDLMDELQAHILRVREFGTERTYIRNSLSFLVPDDAWTYQEYRDCLSDLVVKNIPPLSSFKRVMPAYYHISNDEIKLKLWGKAEELLEFYLANRFIYS